jgi:hypothetical protein
VPSLALLHLAGDQAWRHLPLAHFPPSPTSLEPLTKVGGERVKGEMKPVTREDRQAERRPASGCAAWFAVRPGAGAGATDGRRSAAPRTHRQRRWLSSRGGRGGETTAGPSSGERGGAAEGGACCAWPHHWRKAEEGTSQAARASPERREGKPRVKARTHEGTEETSLLGMGGRNRFLLIRRVGRGCQAKRRKVRILHRREREDLDTRWGKWGSPEVRKSYGRVSAPLSPIFSLFLAPSGNLYLKVQHLRGFG